LLFVNLFNVLTHHKEVMSTIIIVYMRLYSINLNIKYINREKEKREIEIKIKKQIHYKYEY